MSCDKTEGTSCECNPLAHVSDEVLDAEVERRLRIQEKRYDEAEAQRRAFVKAEWPFAILWILWIFVPLGLFIFAQWRFPIIAHNHHTMLSLLVIFFTILLVPLYIYKTALVGKKFEDAYPELAAYLEEHGGNE